MKTLKKLKLKEFQKMNESEMKSIIGGYGAGGNADYWAHTYDDGSNDYTNCRATDKITACYGVPDNGSCCYKYNGERNPGKCVRTLGPLHCSDLN